MCYKEVNLTRMICFDLIRNDDLVPFLPYDESGTTLSFVVVNADMNLFLEDVSYLKALTYSSWPRALAPSG